MQRNHRSHILAISIYLFTISCMATSDDSTGFNTDATGTRVHMMPLHSVASHGFSDVAPPGAQLTYFGGPLLTALYTIPVFWNSKVQFQSTLTSFYENIGDSLWYDVLLQYFIKEGEIDAGPFGWGPFVDNVTSTAVSDRTIQTELNRLFSAGILPLPDSNTYYPVHFPAGVTITAPDGSKSCVVFCAYHGTYVRNGVNVNYGVIPDQGGGCAGSCGGNPSRVNNLTSVASHELAEAATDPAVGLATTFGAPLGWYDQNNGEIGDICNAQQGTTVGHNGATYTIQAVFSNAANNCVTR